MLTDLNDRGAAAPYPLSDFLRAGDAAVFVKGRSSGPELWATDGTASGTRRLPVACDPCSELSLVASDGPRAYFLGDGGLGVTDGTPTGTRALLPTGRLTAVDDFKSETTGPPIPLGGKLFFVAEGPEAGREPWVTDGTPEGTFPLDVFPGPEGSFPGLGAVLGNTLLFSAASEEDCDGLWRTDGTPEGTVRLMAVDPESRAGVSAPIRLGDQALFFVRGGDFEEDELWRTDGTQGGTRPVEEVPGSASRLTVVDQLLFFDTSPVSGGSIWRTDGTPEGTFQAADLRDPDRLVSFYGAAGDSLLLLVRPRHEEDFSLWRSDGTADGTFPMELACEPDCRPRFLLPAVNLGDDLFFSLRDPEIGFEVWVSDGTEAGTHPVEDLCPGRCSSDPELVIQAEDALYVSVHHPVVGRELYRFQPDAPPERLTSFTAAEPFISEPFPRLVFQGVDLPQGPLFVALDPDTGLGVYRAEENVGSTEPLVRLDPARNAGSLPRELLRVGDAVVFTATDGVSPRRLWRIDGSTGATAPMDVLTQDPEDGGPFEPRSLLPYEEGFLLWAEGPEHRFDLLRWTPEAMVRLAEDLPAEPVQSSPPPTVVAKDRVFFVTTEEIDAGTRLWVSDGTTEGTRVVREFTLVSARLHDRLESLGRRTVFEAIARSGGPTELWISDGADAGTHPIFQAPPGSSLYRFRAAEDRLYVITRNANLEDRLFVVDGVAQGGSARRELASDLAISDIVPVGSRLFFTVANRTGEFPIPHDLWVTDGTRAGTRSLTPLGTGGIGGSESSVAILGGSVYLLVAEAGRELPSRILASDGTPAGTRFLDVLPTSLEPTALAAAGNFLVIETTDRDEKRLWVSEGGTEPAQRLGPAFVETDLSELTPAESLAIFPADDGVTGLEPWALDRITPLPPCTPGPRTLCLTRDRFRVEVEWRDPRSGDSGEGFVVPQAQLDDSGFFWFFDEDNVELVDKVLDARAVNGHFWFFSGSLTEVERRITVTDTATGITQVYERQGGDPAGQIDVTAF